MASKRSLLPATTIEKLLRAARSARKNAHCPYSHFAVGAAVLTESGRIHKGANVENASFGATICAERTAITSAVAAGERKFKAIAIIAEGTEPPVPCGACLQVLAEFCPPHFCILLATAAKAGPTRQLRLKDLLPQTFTFRTS